MNAKFPGSSHDSGIWATSPVRTLMRRFHNHNWILGDSGYPLEPWLLTPFPENDVDEDYKRAFNSIHIKTRNTIERSFGVLKSIFRCLLKHRTLNYSPVKACASMRVS